MDKKLFAYIEKQCPKFNPDIANGLAVIQMAHVEQYIDSVMRCAETSFPPGLRYVRYERCKPGEEYAQVTAKRNNRQTYELAKSDVYLVKYYFEFTGPDGRTEELKPRFLYLPYVSDSGLITILGSTFSISPILADPAISVGVDNIFIPLNRDKLTFKRLIHHFVMDGVRETSYVVWSSIYHPPARTRNSPTKRRTIDVNSTIMHYMLCKYGFSRTFAEFGNADVRIGYDEINETNFPKSEWKICESIKIKPKGVKTKLYAPSNIRLAIRHEHYNLTTQSMIGGFFYVVDHFPDRVLPEYVDTERMWKTLMGHVIFATNESEGKLVLNVDAHMVSLDGYIDGMVREWLREDGVKVDNVYELFMHVIETFHTRITQGGAAVSTMYGKRLMVLRWVLMDIIKAIFNVTFQLQKYSKKVLTKNEIVNIMNAELKPELIFRINRRHSEVASISSPSDNKCFKITSNVVLQTNSTGGTRSKAKATIIDPSKHLHASIAEVGQFNNLPKSEPTGRSRINLYISLGPDGSILRDPSKQELIDSVQEAIQR